MAVNAQARVQQEAKEATEGAKTQARLEKASSRYQENLKVSASPIQRPQILKM